MMRLTPALLVFLSVATFAQTESVVGSGWAGNTINTVVFRRNSVVSDKQWQYVAYYDSTGHVVLAKRKTGTQQWEVKQTRYTGNINDAHNSISIILDGNGYLHMSWDHHNNKLNYCRSQEPGSLELTDKMAMTGNTESSVSYPEFYKMPNGDLLFLYRDGGSGRGNLILNRYRTAQRKWERVQNNLVDGEGQRNAYWQACIDDKGVFHISWVWRESPDVASNHDLCYARSADGGNTWQKSDGSSQPVPMNAANAENIVVIPQKSDLINSTSMVTDAKGRPYIATYWRPANNASPQYHLVFFDGKKWQVRQVSQRTGAFSLSGGGTKRIPISRPQVLAQGKKVYLLFRDAERNNRLSVIFSNDITKGAWRTMDLTKDGIGQSEPSFDTELWRRKSWLHVYVQYSGQGDGERTEQIPAQPVRILEWKPSSF
jgi:hypothetical protein